MSHSQVSGNVGVSKAIKMKANKKRPDFSGRKLDCAKVHGVRDALGGAEN